MTHKELHPSDHVVHVPCDLPRARQRWLGLVAACSTCKKLYVLTEHMGHLCWEPIHGEG